MTKMFELQVVEVKDNSTRVKIPTLQKDKRQLKEISRRVPSYGTFRENSKNSTKPRESLPSRRPSDGEPSGPLHSGTRVRTPNLSCRPRDCEGPEGHRSRQTGVLEGREGTCSGQEVRSKDGSTKVSRVPMFTFHQGRSQKEGRVVIVPVPGQ